MNSNRCCCGCEACTGEFRPLQLTFGGVTSLFPGVCPECDGINATVLLPVNPMVTCRWSFVAWAPGACGVMTLSADAQAGIAAVTVGGIKVTSLGVVLNAGGTTPARDDWAISLQFSKVYSSIIPCNAINDDLHYDGVIAGGGSFNQACSFGGMGPMTCRATSM